jgi:hypothetical protein
VRVGGFIYQGRGFVLCAFFWDVGYRSGAGAQLPPLFGRIRQKAHNGRYPLLLLVLVIQLFV